MYRRLIAISVIALSFAANFASATPLSAKLSPTLRWLQAAHQSAAEDLPEFVRAVALAPEINVSVRFASPFELTDWESRGLRLRKIEGRYAGSGTIFGAVMTWEEIPRWAQEANILMIASDWQPKLVPCLDVSAPEVGAPTVWEMLDQSGLPITGSGQIVADFDTGVDVFHPSFFRLSSQRYDWLDINEDSLLTPDVDVVDLNGNQIGEREEVLKFLDGQIYDPAMTFGGNGISNADGVYQMEWDWLYNDADDDGQRDYGLGAGFTESSPGYGEMVFYCDDINGNSLLDVGEQLILLDQSKVRAVMDTPWSVHRRGVDMISASPDENGHGTGVSGILVGGEPGRSRFCGLAPGADLLMGYTYNGVSFEDYLPWVRAEGCRVLLYEFGSWIFNPLDGSTNEELLLSSEASLGVMQVTPSGNLNRGFKHCQLQIAGGENLPIHAGVDEWQGALPTWMGCTFLWREPAIELTISLEDPFGETLTLAGNGTEQTFASWTVWSGFWISPRGTAEYDISLWGTSGEPLVGTWTITAQHPGGTAFELNGYITDNVSAWEGGAEFDDYRSSDKTVTWPATADSAFVLGSYSTRGYEQYIGVGSGSIQPGEISLFSGRGTRIDGMHLLSLAAPGNYDVYSTRSVYGEPYTHGGYRQFSGTSAAGPHVAASAVLVLQADSSLTRLEVESLLEQYAYRDEFTGPDFNDTWGYGKVRVDELVSYLGVPANQGRVALPVAMQLTAYPNPFNSTVALRMELPTREWVDLRVYDLLGREVATIYQGNSGPGVQRFIWQAQDVPSGIYWIKAKTGQAQLAQKVVVLK